MSAGGLLLEKAVPLGRVWSFPKEIKIARPGGNVFLTTHWVSMETLRLLQEKIGHAAFNREWEKDFADWRSIKVVDPVGNSRIVRIAGVRSHSLGTVPLL
jgi:hypothetical protein